MVAKLIGFLACGLTHVVVCFLLHDAFEPWYEMLLLHRPSDPWFLAIGRPFLMGMIYLIVWSLTVEHTLRFLNRIFPDEEK